MTEQRITRMERLMRRKRGTSTRRIRVKRLLLQFPMFLSWSLFLFLFAELVYLRYNDREATTY